MEKKERTYYTEDLIESAIDELQDRIKEEATIEIDDEIFLVIKQQDVVIVL